MVDGLMDVLAYLLGWRAWLCFITGLVAAYFLTVYDIWLVWPHDVSGLVAILALGIGTWWETRSG